MTNNDILIRLRFTFRYSDDQMAAIYNLANRDRRKPHFDKWLKKVDDHGYEECHDVDFSTFLNGFIIKKRGQNKNEIPQPETELTNNIIFMKLKIALNLKSDQVLKILELAEYKLSPHELSAFFRKKGHKHHRICQDQVLRNFLNGVQLKYGKEK